MNKVVIYTDGACRGNPGPGGWGVLIFFKEHRKVLSGAEIHTTNNRMELMAAIQALKALRFPCQVDLYTDSQYLQKGISLWMPAWKKKHWHTSDKKPVKNVDLWQMLDNESQKHQIKWHWVKAHNGHVENEQVDKIANEAIDELLNRTD